MHGRCLIYKYSNRNNSLICKRNNKCCSAKVSFDVQEFLELAADSSEIAIFGLFPVTWNDRGESSVTFVLPKLDVKHTTKAATVSIDVAQCLPTCFFRSTYETRALSKYWPSYPNRGCIVVLNTHKCLLLFAYPISQHLMGAMCLKKYWLSAVDDGNIFTLSNHYRSDYLLFECSGCLF